MSDQAVEEILTRLRAEGMRVSALLQTYQTAEFDFLWKHDARLYREFGRRLIRAGHPTQAFELVREGFRRWTLRGDQLHGREPPPQPVAPRRSPHAPRRCPRQRMSALKPAA